MFRTSPQEDEAPLRVLVVEASPRGDASSSVRLADAFVDALVGALPGAVVDRLDTFTDLPAFGARHVEAKLAVIAGQPVPAAAAAEWAAVLEAARRLRAADVLVLAVPMWNGAIPWTLKLFIDTVTQPGMAFTFSPVQGYAGLLTGRTAFIAATSRVYTPGAPPQFGVDHQLTYLTWWLRFCGIDDVHTVRLAPTLPSPDLDELRRRAHDEASRLARLVAAERVARP